MSKPFWKSKVFWVNTLGTIVAFAGQYGGFVPPEYQPIVVGVVAGINLVLRAIDPQKPITLN